MRQNDAARVNHTIDEVSEVLPLMGEAEFSNGGGKHAVGAKSTEIEGKDMTKTSQPLAFRCVQSRSGVCYNHGLRRLRRSEE
jgi:hypothetical protein